MRRLHMHVCLMNFGLDQTLVIAFLVAQSRSSYEVLFRAYFNTKFPSLKLKLRIPYYIDTPLCNVPHRNVP